MKCVLRLLKPGLVVVCLVLAAFFGALSTPAQTSNGTIVGTVIDKTGAVVPKAKVKGTSNDTGLVRETETDSAGSYRLENLPPGRYTVTVQADGFSQYQTNKVDVKGSFEVTANASLDIGSVTNTVVVEASAAQELQTESGELGAEISRQEVHDLPFFSGNPIELVLTQPGVQDGNGFAFTNGMGFSVDGTRPRANNFLVDGQDNNDNGLNGQAFQTTNLGAIQEVTVLTNSYSAEFGRGGGSVTNEIMKGGTNNYHGETWWQNRNNSFAAISPQAALGGQTVIPRDNENVFGFDFGGPVKKDKLFFFGSAQWDRDYSAAGAVALPITIPTAAGLATLQSLLPNPNVQMLIDSFGGLVAPVSNGNPIPLGSNRGSVDVGDFTRSQGSVVGLTREWEVRVDYNPTSVDSLRGSYRRSDSSLSPDFFSVPTALPPFDTQQGGPAQAFTGVWSHTFSPRALNELRFSYSNIDFTFGPTGATLTGPLANIPEITFNQSPLPNIGIPTGFPQFRGHKSYQFQEALTYTLGRHTFKFGGDIDYLQVDDGVPFNSRGTIGFNQSRQNGVTQFTDLANFVDNFTGPSGQVAINFGNPEVQPFVGVYAPYVQDTWHVKPNLTLDLGLRYEYWGTVGNILPFPTVDTSVFPQGLPGAVFPNYLNTKQQGDKNNFAPRVGFSWTPKFWQKFLGNDKTVIRGGAGMFYDGIFTNILDNSASTVPNVQGGTLIAPAITAPGAPPRGFANATGLLAGLQPVADPTATVNTMATHILNPLTYQWNLNIQRELPGHFVLTTAYVGTRGEHLFTNTQYNPIDPTTGVRMNPTLGDVLVRTNGGDSNYHSGQVTLDRKFTRGLLLRGAYTYSKFIDDTSDVFTTTGFSSFSQNLFDQKGDYGLSAFDRRHRFVMTYIWDLPYQHDAQSRAMKALSYVTRDWQWAGTLTIQTGAPETITDGFDNNGDGRSADRPSLGNLAVPINYSPACFTSDPATSTCDSGVGFSLDGVHFVDFNTNFGGDPGGGTNFTGTKDQFRYVVINGQLGDVGRNTFIGPGQWFYNTSVQRSFRFMERQSITLRMELFNVFNHPNLFTDGGVNSFSVANSNFMNVASTINGNRQVKFWLKYAF